MHEKLLKLHIVTPDRVLFRGDVQSFTAPGELGSFQVLYNHAPLISTLVVGEMKYVDPEGTTIHLATSGGFVEVRENRVLALVETAERSEEIDRDRAKEAKQRAEGRMKERHPETDVERARIALMRALNRIKVAGRAN